MNDRSELLNRIDNALLALNDPGEMSAKRTARTLRDTVEALEFCRAGVTDLQAQLDVATDPELNAAREVVRLRDELERAQARIVSLELDIDSVRQDKAMEEQLNQEDRRRKKELEKKVADYDKLLLTDDDAYSQFMDEAMKRKPPE